ncbi:hypothetical protein E4582_03055 [Luteimonas yindakuii]|uniref:Uncharacterized protein n=1 Tax=Luteimonas yindakuii TaxID=2565782 RepID=A0A4Z1RCF3_9GAMM|nr:hypothetical protein [Luteimonas yindakuii]QCO67583.1 hypothetical protein E5843_07010 [Luteimonas yindakuii]TKS53853.1 hypothetical protein E4582_03055 [Luteimonas yindakuii]
MNLFAIRTLQARSWYGVAISMALLALATWLGYHDFTSGAWLSLVAGFVGLGREAWSLARAARAPSLIVVERQDSFVDQLLERVVPSPGEVDDGHVVTRVPHLREAVVRSTAVDRWLRTHALSMVEDTGKRQEVDARLRGHAPALETLLRCHARQSLRSVPPRVLVNETKLGLSDGVSPSRSMVRVHQVGYFHSLLTNEASTRCLETLHEDPEIVFSGCDQLFPLASRDGPSWPLLPLAQSRMADHIGISTLVVTRDHKLVLWTQGSNAQHSRQQLVSTGSGSCDWDDRTGDDLKATLVRAMEREFVEESLGGGTAPEFQRETRVLGFFRWLTRGAKPEFTGITWVDLDAHSLRPNISEVTRRHRAQLCHDVGTMERLRLVLDNLLQNQQGSVSFWANVLAVREAINEAPEEMRSFLRLPG